MIDFSLAELKQLQAAMDQWIYGCMTTYRNYKIEAAQSMQLLGKMHEKILGAIAAEEAKLKGEKSL